MSYNFQEYNNVDSQNFEHYEKMAKLEEDDSNPRELHPPSKSKSKTEKSKKESKDKKSKKKKDKKKKSSKRKSSKARSKCSTII